MKFCWQCSNPITYYILKNIYPLCVLLLYHGLPDRTWSKYVDVNNVPCLEKNIYAHSLNLDLVTLIRKRGNCL